MKRILVTGGTGFIGKNLVEFLSNNYMVFAPRHAELELLNNEAVHDYVLANKIDIIIHSAVHVPMINGKENEYENDMTMFNNIASLSDDVDKILYFGSGAEYDKSRDISLIKEEEIGVRIPLSEYGKAKLQMNTTARQSKNIYNLRLFGVFGKYELWQIKFISNICCKTIFDLPLTIRKDCYFDYLYIDDLCNIVEYFINNEPRHHDYNVCSGKEYLLSEIAKKVLFCAHKELKTTIFDTNGLNYSYSGSNARLHDELPIVRDICIDNGIGKLYNYYVLNKDCINYDVLKQSK